MQRLLVAIPNFMREEKDLRMLMRCIASIRKHEPLIAFHVVVFDDASPYFTDAAQYEILYAGAKFIRHETNGGYSRNINLAFKYAADNNYDFILTLNSDVEITSMIYHRAMQVFNYDYKIAVIGGLCLYPTGKIQSASFRINHESIPIQPDRFQYYNTGGHTAAQPKYVMGVTGAFQFIRMSALPIMGLYSEKYEMGYEDVEFCCRAWSRDYRVFYDPHLSCIHSESVTRGLHIGPRELASLQQWHDDFDLMQISDLEHLVSLANAQAPRQSQQ